MLFCLLDDRARTSTELAAVADVGTSTASAHLDRLARARLVSVSAQGRYRYYRLRSPEVARLLEGMAAVAGSSSPAFIPKTPRGLRAARTCYDHIAGGLGVRLHDRFLEMGWVSREAGGSAYAVTAAGARKLQQIGVDLGALGRTRRKAAYGCLDWSERRFHLGGALGALLLEAALRLKWVSRDLEGRGLTVTARGLRELPAQLGVHPPEGC